MLAPEQLRRMAFRYFRSCVGREMLLTEYDLPDLVSDVVSAVWLRRQFLDCPERYVMRACRNRLIHFLSSKRQRLRLQHEWYQDYVDSMPNGLGSEQLWRPDLPESNAERGACNEAGSEVQAKKVFLRQSVERADGRLRLIIHLRHVSGMSWSDISELTGISAPSARMREQRFRSRVRRTWERTWQHRILDGKSSSLSRSQ